MDTNINEIREKIENIIRSYGIPTEEVEELFNGAHNLSNEQINELKKVLATTIITANDKGKEVPKPEGKDIDYNNPQDVANTASETIEYIQILFEIFSGNLQRLEEIVNRVLNYATASLVANVDWLAEHGVELSIAGIKGLAFGADYVIPGFGEYIYYAADYIDCHKETTIHYIQKILPFALNKLNKLLQSKTHKFAKNKETQTIKKSQTTTI